MMQQFTKNIFAIKTAKQFEQQSLQLFEYQYNNNTVYRNFCRQLLRNPQNVISIEDIPFLPISFFKTHQVVSTHFEAQSVFCSSGSSSIQTRSKHYIKDISLYKYSFYKTFQKFYGNIQDYTLLALLPNYMENPDSSLIYMVDNLMQQSQAPDNGYYLSNHQQLFDQLQQLAIQNRRVILFGVSYALLDFAKHYSLNFPNLIVMETGGMKGRGKELVREELHDILRTGFGVSEIHSEYGMCELLSQAYSLGNNVFQTPPWMRLLLRDEKDPLSHSFTMASGVINVIDLANIYSCAFIATDDLGKLNKNGMEILGRIDHAEIKGCNMLIL